MVAYLDNAATTKVSQSVKNIMVDALEVNYGNPSSMHKLGIDAEKYIKDAKDIIARSIKVEPKEIIFTSGGTESNNFALIGAALANARAGKHIITTQFEHPSVHNPLIALEDFGFRISYIPVDKNGLLDMEWLLNEICDETILVSVMHVNNEVGATQDIGMIAKRVKEKKADILFHVDGIQGFGKYIVYPKRMGIDLMSVSGHKIHGPKGSGFLFIRDKVKIKPIMFGGGQQKGFRSGTENVPAIAGLGQAVKDIFENQEHKIKELYQLKQEFVERLTEIDDVTVHAIFEEEKDSLTLAERIQKTAPHIVSASFAGIKSEVLLHALEDAGVYVSSGSACASNHPSLSGSLMAIGVDKDLLDSTLRFSFSVNTTKEEIEYAILKLKEIVPMLRRYIKK